MRINWRMGRKRKWRETMFFHKDNTYEEAGLHRVLTLDKFRLSAQFEGLVNAVWLCIYVFDAIVIALRIWTTFLLFSQFPGTVEKNKRRATTKDVARIALADLAKYFDLPIVKASKNLKVGLIVLKKKRREFGTPRWRLRKIKSLDCLIHDLQDDEAAAMMVSKRQRMLESEKESIERKPFMEIQMETKKFRQDIFKKRPRARASENQIRTMSEL